MSPGPGERPYPAEPELPRTIGTFEIIEEIGRGGMGVVFRAHDSKLDRDVALKRPHLDLLERPGFRNRFIGEARASSRLMHPNITTVLEVIEENGVPWMVMELVEGASLRSLLAERRPLDIEFVMKHAEGLTDALRVAHLAGTLHCDINPNNILIGRDDRARLSDFGLARAREELDEPDRTSAQTTQTQNPEGIAGTRGYMSPEQALGRKIDQRSDVFSLGLVLYEMCTGVPAFCRTDSDDWLDALLHREPPAASGLNTDVPFELQEILSKSIAKRRFQRYQSAKEMLIDIRAARRQLESDSGWTSNRRRPRFGSRRKAFLIGGAIAAAAAVSIAAVVMLGNWKPEVAKNWESRQLTSAPGWEIDPAFSPSGSFIAYSSNESGNADIWLLDVRAGNSLQLTFDEPHDSDPAWTPDESSITYVSTRDGEDSIWRIPRLGGAPVLVMEDAEDPAFSPDGRYLAFARADDEGYLRIHTAPIDDLSRVTRLTGKDDGLWNHRSPAWSPDGKTLCYSDFRNLRLVPVAGGPSRALTDEHAIDLDPVWTPDGRRIFFSSMRGNAYALWSIPLSTGVPERLTAGTGPERNPTFSADGLFIAYSTFGGEKDVVILDRVSRRRFRLQTSSFESSPNISPDGNSVIFVSNMRGKFDLWVQRLVAGQPTGEPERLTDHPGGVALPTFSEDGQWIAYLRVIDGQRDIWLISADGGVPVRFTDHPATDIQPAFSPTGDQIVFVSDRSGNDELWIDDVRPGPENDGPKQLTRGEGVARMPAWSSDGSTIAYIRDYDVWVVQSDGSEAPTLLTENAEAQVVKWNDATGELAVSGLWQTEEMVLRTVSPIDGTVAQFDPPVVFGNREAYGLFGISNDGRYVAYLATQSNGDLWLMEAR